MIKTDKAGNQSMEYLFDAALKLDGMKAFQNVVNIMNNIVDLDKEAAEKKDKPKAKKKPETEKK